MKNIVINLFEIIRNFYINPNPELFQALYGYAKNFWEK